LSFSVATFALWYLDSLQGGLAEHLWDEACGADSLGKVLLLQKPRAKTIMDVLRQSWQDSSNILNVQYIL